jgi:hypothetical protein
MKRRVDDLNYLRPFFIGLLEGDGTIIPLTGKLVPLGTITVFFSNNILYIRIIIALKRTKNNIEMLTLLKKNIGGKISLNDKYVK